MPTITSEVTGIMRAFEREVIFETKPIMPGPKTNARLTN